MRIGRGKDLTRAVAAALPLLMAACAGEPPVVQTVIPPSNEPFDLSTLNGKIILVKSFASGDYATDPPQGNEQLQVVGKTIVWSYGWQMSQCVLNGIPYGRRLAVLATPDQPRSNVKVSCEALSRTDGGSTTVTAPADVTYSSTLSVEGNVLTLSAALDEHHSATHEPQGFDRLTVTEDVTERLQAKIRLSADQCQILEWSWNSEVQGVQSSIGKPYTKRRSVKATGCSIVAVPK